MSDQKAEERAKRVREWIFSPPQVSKDGSEHLLWRQAHADLAVRTGIANLDEVLLPLLPPENVIFQALSSHGKTSFLMAWARNRAHYLMERKIRNRAIVIVSWEQSIEEMYAFLLAAERGIPIDKMARGQLSELDWKEVRSFSIANMGTPIWLIGNSVQRNQEPLDITVEVLVEALTIICNWTKPNEFVINLVIGDYLQNIPLPEQFMRQGAEGSYTLGVGENARQFKRIGFRFNCPTVLGAQTKQDVEKRDDKVPRIADIEWTNVARQVGDKILFGYWPIKHYSHGKEVHGITINEDDYMAGILKKKLGKAGIKRWLKFFPAFNKFEPGHIKHVQLNPD